ncbi:MAG: hypothetical protein EBR18_07090 [Betaproteobacteria bacterium]|nr:hypothetical protein [Betaproteobacteria bacterium]
MARRLVDALAIQGASIIGQPGGWSVLLQIGAAQKPLGVQRSDKPRTWRSLDRCVDYLKNELHLSRFDLLDATLHSDVPAPGKPRSDAAQRMRQTHQAAAYDKWFRAQVAQSLQEADDPTTVWLENSAVATQSAERRAQWRARAKAFDGQST